MNPDFSTAIAQRLRDHGIKPTLARLQIAQIMLARPQHLGAETVLEAVRASHPEISRATVYGTLRLLCDHKLLSALPLPGQALVFDSSTHPHHHLIDLDTGAVSDLAIDSIPPAVRAALPAGLEEIDLQLVVQVRRKRRA